MREAVLEKLDFDQPTLPALPTVAIVGLGYVGLPVAVQFVGKHLGEAEIFRAGRAFQRVTDWHRRHPRI